jgi:hypothetical protein
VARGSQYRLSSWDPLIVQSAKEHGIDPNLLRGILWQESNFDPNQTGQMTKYGRAKGIAQLTDDTAKEFGVTDPYDPQQAIPAAARLLKQQRDIGVAKGAASPDAYAAMAYYGGPGFKPTNRPAAGVAGPDVQGYASSVLGHAGQFASLTGSGQLTAPPVTEAAGPPSPGAPAGLHPTSWPLPTDWADVPGAPPSMRYAPPSMFGPKATSPEQQALYERVSTPQGYEAAVRQLAGAGTSNPAAAVREDPARSVPTALPPTGGPGPGPPPVITGPGNVMPPAGGSQGWAGVQGAPGGPSGPGLPGPLAALASVGRGETDPASYWQQQQQQPPQAAAPPAVAPSGPLVSSPTQPVYNEATGGFEQRPRPPAVATLTEAPAAGNRTLSDEQLAKMGPEDVFGVVANEGLTDADRLALNDRLNELQRQQSSGGR